MGCPVMYGAIFSVMSGVIFLFSREDNSQRSETRIKNKARIEKTRVFIHTELHKAVTNMIG